MEIIARVFAFKRFTSIGLFQKKSTPPPPRQMACWKFSREGGLRALEIWVGGGGFEPKNPSSGVIFYKNLDLFKQLL